MISYIDLETLEWTKEFEKAKKKGDTAHYEVVKSAEIWVAAQRAKSGSLVENAYCFLAPLTFSKGWHRRLEEIARNGYIDISKTKGETRRVTDFFAMASSKKEGVRISLSQAHSKGKLIKLGSSGFLHSSPGAS